jgi:hypothetical protein
MTTAKVATPVSSYSQGTFNEVALEKIIWVRMVTTGNGKVLRSLRTTDPLQELDRYLRLGDFAVLQLPCEKIEGRIIAFGLHPRGEYEVTLEVALDNNTGRQRSAPGESQSTAVAGRSCSFSAR